MEVRCVIVSACKLHLMMHLQLPLSFLEYILHWQELSQGTIPNDLKMIKLPFILFELLITYADSGGCLSQLVSACCVGIRNEAVLSIIF